MRNVTALAASFAMLCSAAHAELAVSVAYLRQAVERPPVLSDLDPVPADEGIVGAELAINELQTTGAFLGQSYALSVTEVPASGDLKSALSDVLSRTRLVLLDVPGPAMPALADLPGAQGALMINVSAPDTGLRQQDCRVNLLHSLPSDAMRADALMQYLTVRRWDRLALLSGRFARDQAWAEALRQSARKFGLTLREDEPWAFDGNLGRTAQAEIPQLLQGFNDHDVLLVADEIGDFGRYVLFNTWLPRPTAGSEGITPQGWSPVLENWGASQLQGRFHDLAGRSMRPVDYAAWAAVRALGEGVIRTGSDAPQDLHAYLLSPEFGLDGFKGRPLSFRDWNGQLRQPIPVTSPRAMLAMAPFEAFLHADNDLDTLGSDRPETLCTAFED